MVTKTDIQVQIIIRARPAQPASVDHPLHPHEAPAPRIDWMFSMALLTM